MLKQIDQSLRDAVITNQVKAAVKNEPDPMTVGIQQLTSAINDHTGELNRLNASMYSLMQAITELKDMKFTIKSGY